MKKTKFIIAICVLSVVTSCLCSCKESTKQTAQEQFCYHSEKAIENKTWISFDVYHEKSKIWSAAYYTKKDNPAIIVTYPDNLEIWKFDRDTFSVCDIKNRELSKFNRAEDKEFYNNYRFQQESRISNISTFYQYSLPDFKSSQITTICSMCDSIVRGHKCTVFEGWSNIGRYGTFNGTEKVVLGYYQTECRLWINFDNHQIDSLILLRHEHDSNDSMAIHKSIPCEKKMFYVKNMSFDDRSPFFDSIFNFNAKYYKEFTKHDNTNIPFSWLYSENDSVIPEKMLSVPLININGDTTTIGSFNGWLLLDLWSYNCSVCLKNLTNLGCEIDSLGYRIIENEGIKILAVNYQSDNPELLRKVAEKTHCDDILYMGKGIQPLINIPTLGYAILLSPQKSIVYAGNMSDYENIIKIKESQQTMIK